MSFIKKTVTRLMRRKLAKLDDLYQRHVGEECYIFGNGISLKWMDLHQFSNKISIGEAMLNFHKEASVLNMPYAACVEPFFFYPFFPYEVNGRVRLIRHYFYKEVKKAIIENPDRKFFINFSNYPVARYSNALYVSRWYHPLFNTSNPFADRLDAQSGTFRFQLSLAIFLGFKKAYLVGHDYTHFPSRVRHFYEKGQGTLNIDGHKSFANDYINYAKQHIDLITVTLDGISEKMNYVTYKELTGKDPCFRENIELVNRTRLESLATWKGYEIF